MSDGGRTAGLLGRAVDVRPGEIPAMLGGFA